MFICTFHVHRGRVFESDRRLGWKRAPSDGFIIKCVVTLTGLLARLIPRCFFLPSSSFASFLSFPSLSFHLVAMPSLASILVTLSLPLYAFSAHHGNHAHRHVDLALRARGDVIQKRDFSGSFTWYDITVGLTACGGSYGPNDWVVALDAAQFGSSYPSPYCGAAVTLTYNGKTANAIVVDECAGCYPTSLDCTEGLFQYLTGGLGAGRVQGEWSFGGGNAAPSPTSTTPTYTPQPTTHYDPPAPTTSTSYTPPPTTSSSSSTSTSTTSASQSSTSTTSTTSQAHSSSTPSSTSTSSVPNYSHSASGLAQPTGSVTTDGQNSDVLNLMNQAFIGLGSAVMACDH
ncbi:hypothetical protein BJV74DRAFT_812299 [Russula compacta]|nr:hypothetical protein BJV74DRAFT_812299 [Russula compacta]